MADRIVELFGNVSVPLTTHVLGYGGNRPFIGTKILPIVPFPSLSVVMPLFGKEALKKADKPVRPLYGVPATVRISKSEATYNLEEVSLGAQIDRRERMAAAKAQIPWDVESAQANFAKSLVINDREYRIASLVRTSANYNSGDVTAVASGAKWNLKTSGVSDVNPLEVLDLAFDTKAKEIGVRPNVAWMGRDVWRGIKYNTQVHETFFGTQAPGTVTSDMVRQWLGLDEFLVGSASYMDDAGTMTDVWGTDFGACYRNPNPHTNPEPTFGFTALGSFGELGTPAGGQDVLGFVTSWDENPYVRRVDYTEFLKAHIAMKDAGLLYTGAVS